MALQAVLLSPHIIKGLSIVLQVQEEISCPQLHNKPNDQYINSDVVCYVWLEANGGLNASEFASIVTI